MSARVMVITGSRKGIGRYLTEQYLECGDRVIGCSRKASDLRHDNYEHYELNVANETAVCAMIRDIVAKYGRIDVLLNNAGIASMKMKLK